MNNVIIGTAGHVDHGKTSLIKALTGIDTDRLKEEKKRGITIELGFAHLDLDGKKIGIVDVPGHEKFVKNMLAGSGGIDIALLIVSANEGVMPQTKEHLEILKLLNIKKGIIVITKVDMAERAWIDMVKEDIRAVVKGSFLEDSLVVETSVYNNIGIDELKKAIGEISEESIKTDMDKDFRLPVDRIFSVDGFGTVITGTLIEGSISKGENVAIYTSQLETKVRNLQVHDINVDTAYMGQRVAINLASIKKEDIKRGFVIAKPNTMENTFMLDVVLNISLETERVIKNNSRVHFYHGSSEVLAKIILLDKNELKSGEKAFAQLRLEEEIAVKYGDRYIIRFYSPMETVGGGMIVNPNPRKHQRNNDETIFSLSILEKGSEKERVEEFIKEKSYDFPAIRDIELKANIGLAKVKEMIKELEKEKKLVLLTENIVISIKHFENILKKSEKILLEYHSKNMFKKGINMEEYKSKLFANVSDNIINEIVTIFENNKHIIINDSLVASKGFKVKFDDSNSKTAKEIEKLYLDAKILVPNKDDILSNIKDNNKLKIFASLVESGTLVMIDKQMFFHRDVYTDALEMLNDYINKNGQITLAEFRDIIGASRKYAVALLEHWDSKKVTKKIGDGRVLFKSK